MSETAFNMEYLFCCGKRTLNSGCGCNLKTSTQMISFLGLIMSIPLMIGIMTMNWKDYEEVPIIFLVYEVSGCLAPLLMFIGSIKMSFGVSYVGYIMHSIYIYGLIIFSIFIGVFWGILVLPTIITTPPMAVFFIFYFLFWIGYVSVLLYFNQIYFSFTKFLGQGDIRKCMYCEPALIYPQAQTTVLINSNAQENI